MRKMTPEEVIEFLASLVVGKYPTPSAVIAQIILEVGFALNTPKDIYTGRESFNLANIKGEGPAGSVTKHTIEYYDEKSVEWARNTGILVQVHEKKDGKYRVTIEAKFRAYHNYAESIDDHVQFLKKERYVRAGVWEAETPLEYANAIYNAGYATDPKYVDKIMSLIDRYQLTRFDPERRKEGEGKLELKEQWQWDMLVTALKDFLQEGIITDPKWIEKAEKKEFTVSELTWLNTIILSRLK